MRIIFSLGVGSSLPVDWIAHVLHLSGSKAHWWHQHGERLLDALVISFGTLLLIVVAGLVWHSRTRFIPASHSRQMFRLWIGLVTFVFSGSGLLFALASLPDRVSNVRALVPLVAELHRPIYTDQFTANDLLYLFHYHAPNIQNEGSFEAPTLDAVLTSKHGCMIINEPELDQLAGDGLRVSPQAYDLLNHLPKGWTMIKRFPSNENALEHIAVLCPSSSQ